VRRAVLISFGVTIAVFVVSGARGAIGSINAFAGFVFAADEGSNARMNWGASREARMGTDDVVLGDGRAMSLAHRRHPVRRPMKLRGHLRGWRRRARACYERAPGMRGEEHLRVFDFGLAKIADAPPLTMTGALLGTAFYMSPEQAAGKPVDARSDLYSVGCRSTSRERLLAMAEGQLRPTSSPNGPREAARGQRTCGSVRPARPDGRGEVFRSRHARPRRNGRRL
jgi:serine/threonine protein kinase